MTGKKEDQMSTKTTNYGKSGNTTTNESELKLPATDFNGIYAAYDGDKQHGKYWRALQSAKPIRFSK